MPTLPITTDGSTFVEYASDIIWLTMHFPNSLEDKILMRSKMFEDRCKSITNLISNDDYRKTMLAHITSRAASLSQEIKEEEAESIFDELIGHASTKSIKELRPPIIISTDQFDIRKKEKSQRKKGYIVSLLLQIIVCLHLFDMKPSANKSFFIAEQLLKEYPEDLSDSGIEVRNKTDIVKAWSAFKNVSHLWAAFSTNHPAAGGQLDWISDKDHLFAFMCRAKWFEEKAISIKAKGQKIPIVDPSKIWSISLDIENSHDLFGTFDLAYANSNTSLKHKILDIVKNYEAPRPSY